MTDPRPRRRRRRWWWKVRALAGVGLLALPACGQGGGGEATRTLNWYIFNPGASVFTDAAAACSRASGGAYRIDVRYLPASADGQRQQMVRRLAAQDSSLDILGLDVTWTPEFAEAGWIAPWPKTAADAVRKDTLPTMIQTATWKGKLYSAPYNTNTQLLWYRKDLVKTPPRTWKEMISMAGRLARQGKPHYVEIQGAQYEGYVVWVNSLVSSAGGQILSDDGSKVALGPAAVRGLQVIPELAGSPAADPSLANQMEDQNRLAFESGSAAFELNYPFVYPSAKANAPKIFAAMGWARWPQVVPGKPSRVTIGGIDLAVSAYSPNKQAAFDAIRCLRAPQRQVTNAIKAGLPPVLERLYTDPPASFRQQYPFYQTIYQTLQDASVRPKTPAYQSVSIVIATRLSPPSSVNPRQDVRTLRTALTDALNSKGLIP